MATPRHYLYKVLDQAGRTAMTLALETGGGEEDSYLNKIRVLLGRRGGD